MKINKTTKTAASAGVGGAIVGAGIATVVTRVLSDKKNRDKAGQVLEEVRKKISDIAKNDATNAKNVKKALKSSSRSTTRKGVSASTRVKENAKQSLQPRATSASQT